MSETLRAVQFVARERAELREIGLAPEPGPGEVAGPTLFSLISPGTELNGGYLGERLPCGSGYAAVFRLEALGEGVDDLALGQEVFCFGGHQSHQCQRREAVVPLPDGLAAELAPFCRFLAVSMTTLTTTTSRPPEKMLVTGLGLVGHLASQVFRIGGWEVGAVDPVESRRELAARCGCAAVFAEVPLGHPAWQDQVGLVLDCSGHEAPVLDGARIVRKRGEVVLLGTPWRRRTELLAHELTHLVFHRYVTLRSGWEWELPRQPRDFAVNSILGNHAAAMRWLADGRVVTAGLAETISPAEAQAAYQALLHQTAGCLTFRFDWNQVS